VIKSPYRPKPLVEIRRELPVWAEIMIYAQCFLLSICAGGWSTAVHREEIQRGMAEHWERDAANARGDEREAERKADLAKRQLHDIVNSLGHAAPATLTQYPPERSRYAAGAAVDGTCAVSN
jgi:hypothetical protein